MPAPFAFLEARVNAAVRQRLCNCTVTAGALVFDAIYEAPGESVVDGLLAATQPRLTAVPVAVAAQLQRDQELAFVDPTTGLPVVYRMVQREPDGSGFSMLYLRA